MINEKTILHMIYMSSNNVRHPVMSIQRVCTISRHY